MMFERLSDMLFTALSSTDKFKPDENISSADKKQEFKFKRQQLGNAFFQF